MKTHFEAYTHAGVKELRPEYKEFEQAVQFTLFVDCVNDASYWSVAQ
jgi:hypothetical protein